MKKQKTVEVKKLSSKARRNKTDSVDISIFFEDLAECMIASK